MAMEDIEFKDINEIDAKQIIDHYYYFSADERNHITGILKNHNKENIKEFIDRVEIDIRTTFRIQRDWNPRSHADQIEKLDSVIKKIEAASKYILQIASGRFKPILPRQCNFLVEWTLEERRNSRDSRGAINFEAGRNARIIYQPIRLLVENLRSAWQIEKLKRGRPRTDELEFTFQIAKNFKRFIGVPRPNAGPFPKICYYCFGIVGIKGNKRTRTIRQALKKASSSCLIKPA
jgi:hypothetical protein